MVSGESRWEKRERIRTHLLDLVEETGTGRPIPGERQLCEELGVSRPTLRSVVDDLVRDGLLVREHGRGVFVARAKVAQHLSGPAPGQGQGQGLGVGGVDGTWASRTLDFKTVAAGPRIGHAAGHGAQRADSADHPAADGGRRPDVCGDPACPARAGPRADRPRPGDRLLLPPAGKRYEILLTDASQSIEPTVVDEWEAELLGVSVHTPALLFERAARAADGRVVEFTRSVYRGDRYRIFTRLSLAAQPDGGRVVDGSWSAATTVPGADTLVFDPYWSS